MAEGLAPGAPGLAPGATASAVACAKGWQPTSWITAASVGSHCAGARFASKYDCAARCAWSPARLSAPACAAAAAAYAPAPAACARHLPCAAGSPGAADPAAPDGPCFCCELALDAAAVEANPRVSSGQLWALFAGQLVFSLWALHLVAAQLRAAAVAGSRVVGAADYSIWISGIAAGRAADAPLAHWAGQFGAVVAALNVPSVGDALRVGRKVADLELRAAEAAALRGSASRNPLQWLYRKAMVGGRAQLAEKLERQRRKLAIYERQVRVSVGWWLC